MQGTLRSVPAIYILGLEGRSSFFQIFLVPLLGAFLGTPLPFAYNHLANQNLKATKVLGRIVNVGRLGGTHGEFNFDLHAARRISYIGVTFRTRSIEEIREIFNEVRKDIWGAVESRKLQLPIDKVYPFAEIGKAFEHMEANKHLGKIVVRH